MILPEDYQEKAWLYVDIQDAAHMIEPGRGVNLTIDGKNYVLLDAETYDRITKSITGIKLL